LILLTTERYVFSRSLTGRKKPINFLKEVLMQASQTFLTQCLILREVIFVEMVRVKWRKTLTVICLKETGQFKSLPILLMGIHFFYPYREHQEGEVLQGPLAG